MFRKMSIQAINDVLPILDSLENNVSVKEAQKTLQELLKTIDEIIIFQKKPEMKKYSHKMKLCSCQMAKVLPPLCRVISSGTDPAFKEICHYLIAKLRWCLSEIVRILNGGGVDQDSEPSGLFVQSIVNFVSFLNDGKELAEDVSISKYIEDILCHSLTIATIAENEDYNEIGAACRNVLACTADIKSIEEIESEPLKKDSIFCALVNLERKVNIGVLRLFLYIMSKFLPPLKSIIKRSITVPIQSKQPGDIDQELRCLDLYFERVQLVGNYAVACSECKKKKLKVESSLASLEFLADYIIPTAESYYMDSSNIVKRRFLQFLTDECIDELKTLTNLLDNIIDTLAFFQVLQEDLSHLIPNMKIKYSKGLYEPHESTEIITKCYKLVSHLKVTDDPIVKDNIPLLNKTKEFLNVVRGYSELVREKQPLNDKKFYDSLDNIILKVDELDELLNSTYMDRSQKQKCSHLESNEEYGAVTSTPFVPAHKENGEGNTYPEPGPVGSRDYHSLDPYLNMIYETPVVRTTLYHQTPYKSLRKRTPRNLSFDISEVLESLNISCTPEEIPNNDDFDAAFAVGDDLQKSMFYESEMANISVGPSEFESVNTLRRNFDINFLESKIKELTTNEP